MNDEDYRENQRRAQRAWVKRCPEYWKRYREAHPETVERNRLKQRERDQRRRERRVAASAASDLAKKNVSSAQRPLPSGTYELRPVMQAAGALDKMDVWHVQIAVLSSG